MDVYLYHMQHILGEIAPSSEAEAMLSVGMMGLEKEAAARPNERLAFDSGTKQDPTRPRERGRQRRAPFVFQRLEPCKGP